MSQTEELTAAIEALQSNPVGNGRQLAVKDADQLMPALLAECEMTILPRQLKFTNEAGAVLGVTVSNRRVFDMARLAKPDASPKAKDLDIENAKQMTSLRKTLAEFVSKQQHITVASSEPAQSLGSGRVGVPAAKLAALWGLETTSVFEPKDHGGAEVFAEMIQPEVLCCVILEDDNVVLSFGEADMTKSLTDTAKEKFGSLSKLLEENCPMEGATKRLVVLSVSPQDGEAMICATAHASTLLALIPSASVPNVLKKWQFF